MWTPFFFFLPFLKTLFCLLTLYMSQLSRERIRLQHRRPWCDSWVTKIFPSEGVSFPLQYSCASLVVQTVKNLPAMWETWVRSLDWEDPLERILQHTPVLLPGEPHGQRSLEGHSSWGRKESETNEGLGTQILPAMCGLHSPWNYCKEPVSDKLLWTRPSFSSFLLCNWWLSFWFIFFSLGLFHRVFSINSRGILFMCFMCQGLLDCKIH